MSPRTEAAVVFAVTFFVVTAVCIGVGWALR